jgi:hypothetical protein
MVVVQVVVVFLASIEWSLAAVAVQWKTERSRAAINARRSDMGVTVMRHFRSAAGHSKTERHLATAGLDAISSRA